MTLNTVTAEIPICWKVINGTKKLIQHYWHMSQPTLQRGCEKAKTFVSKGENKRSRHQRLFEENIRKPKKDQGLQILKMRVQELFTHKEGISISHTRHKGRQPLIKCAKSWLQNYVFSLFMLIVFDDYFWWLFFMIIFYWVLIVFYDCFWLSFWLSMMIVFESYDCLWWLILMIVFEGYVDYW